MITIKISKPEPFKRTVGDREIVDEREVNIYEQKIPDDKFDLESVIAAANTGLQKKAPDIKK